MWKTLPGRGGGTPQNDPALFPQHGGKLLGKQKEKKRCRVYGI